MDGITKLLASIRRACKPAIWSKGVTLARDGGVRVESRDEEEIVARVKAPGRPVAPTVVLYPGEREWDCDCGSRVSPCEHIAAAAISLGQEGEPHAAGDTMDESMGRATATARPAETAWGRVVYRLAREPGPSAGQGGGLRLARDVVYPDGRTVPITTTLSAMLARPAEAQTLAPEETDLQADLLLGAPTRAALTPSKLDALLRVLAGCPRVLLDGHEVAIADDELRPIARVDDAGDDVVVTLLRPPEVVDVPSAGVALCAEDGGLALRRLAETERAGAFLQHVPIATRYPPRALGELAATVLPDLVRRHPVEIRSRRVPKLVRDLPPRLVLDLAQLGDGLSVLPTLVYGAPPCARVDDGRLVHLEGPVPVRDLAAEKALLLKLRADLDLLPGHRTTFAGPDAGRFAQKLRRWRGDLTGPAAAVVSAARRLEPRLRIDTAPAADGGPPAVTFDLRFTVTDGAGSATGPTDSEARSVDAAAVMHAWREGLGLVPLEGGGWAELPHAWLDAHGARVLDLLAARESGGRLATHALPALGELAAELDHPPPPGLDALAPLAAGFESLPEPDLPKDLTASLRPYQRQGVAWLAFLRRARLGGILADDMGLGKTLQALCVAGPGTLVVCPTSVLHNWAAELRRFRPALRVSIYHGPGRTLDDTADVTLTTYALLRLDGARLAARRFRAVFLDEAQGIKNPTSQTARAAFALEADFRVALTGTPLENRLDELWSLCHFTNRGLLGGRGDFDERYAQKIAAGEAGAAAALRRRVRPFVLRRRKSEVAPELPPRTESVLEVELDERERVVYDAVRAATQAEVVKLLEAGGGVMKALEALLRLRQAACHPALLPGQTAPSSSKVDALVEALGTAAADGHKALVFSQWTSLLDLIEPHLRAADIGFTRLDGSTRDRAGVTASFQSEGGPPVMLVSLRAGGTGLNLTAADHVFLCDPWWNPAVEAQAADRAHRIGQERPVMVYRLVARATVEERILALQEQKRALFEAALGDAGAAAALTRDDLLALLG